MPRCPWWSCTFFAALLQGIVEGSRLVDDRADADFFKSALPYSSFEDGKPTEEQISQACQAMCTSYECEECSIAFSENFGLRIQVGPEATWLTYMLHLDTDTGATPEVDRSEGNNNDQNKQ